MTDLSTKISELADQFDPDRDHDAQMVRSLIQGAMYVQTGSERPARPLSSLIKISSVEQGKDVHGDYLPYFTIATQAGHRIRVTLEVEQ